MNPLQGLKLSEGSSDFIKQFPAKIRVLSTDPLVNLDKFGGTKFAFPVWSYDEQKAMILNKGASIVKGIQQIDADEDYGGDVTAVDIKILSSGEGKETRYSVNVLPKTQDLTEEQVEAVNKLDTNLSKIIKNGVRASEFNKGKKPTAEEEYEPEETPIEAYDDLA